MVCPVLIDPACLVVGQAVKTATGAAASGALNGVADDHEIP